MIYIVLMIMAVVVASATAPNEFSVIVSGSTFRVVPRSEANSDEAAWGTWDDSYDKVGWSILAVHTNPAINDTIAATAAGFFEGQMTALRIEQYAYNMGTPIFNVSDSMRTYLTSNAEWTAGMIKFAQNLKSGTADRKIWYHQSLLLAQLEGLYQGYLVGRAALSKPALSSPLTREHMLLVNAAMDLDDLENYTQAEQPDLVQTCESEIKDVKKIDARPGITRRDCSAIVRLTDDNQDVFIGQETWATLETMVRIWKLYDFPFLLDSGSTQRVLGQRVSFPSYPGSLASLDDLYVISSGLVVLETTITNNNPALYEEYLTPFSLFEFSRNIIANRLADTGASWGAIYRKYNSGTYNNMNMVFDYKLFVPGRTSLANNTMLLVEQIPGHVVTTDVSNILSQNRYFASYNIPFDPALRNLIGWDKTEMEYGPQFSYDQAPRAQIYRRDIGKVQTLDDVKKLLRSCDFKNDPLSSQLPTCEHLGWTNCTPTYSAQNCLAARGDLNPADGVWSHPSFGHRNHVASDAKITHYQAYNPQTLAADAVCGPVGSGDNPSTPNFRWSTSDFAKSVRHLGQPDVFDFDWINIQFAK